MSVPTKDTSHVTEALALLIGRYASAANVKSLVKAYVNRIQDLENVLWDVIDAGLLATPPTGAALDQLGDLVGEPRGAFDDPTYLVFVKGAIKARRSGGRGEDLLAIMTLILTSGFSYFEFLPKQFDFYALNIPAAYGPPLGSLLHRARPAGTYGVLDWSDWPASQDMTWEDSVGGGQGHGFRDYVSGQFPFLVISAIAL